MKALWNRCEALNAYTVAGIIYSKKIIDEIKKLIKSKFDERCTDEEVIIALNAIMQQKVDLEKVKVFRINKPDKKIKIKEGIKPEISPGIVIADAETQEPLLN